MSIWVQVGLLVLTGASLLLHASHNKKLNDIGDDLDAVKGLVGEVGSAKGAPK